MALELRRLELEIQIAKRTLAALSSEESRVLAAVDARCTPLPWPPDLPERYREEALRAVFSAGFPGVGFDLDCTEFPCLAIIDGEPEPLATRRLTEGPYADGKVVEYGFGTHGQLHHFVALLPESMAEERVVARVHGRIFARGRDLAERRGGGRSPDPENPADPH